MNWIKKGLIFKPQRIYAWMHSHAQVPFAEMVSPEIVRVYFGTRDQQNRTVTTYLELDAADLTKIVYLHDQPVLSLGSLGAFDDCGVMPSWIVKHKGARYLYYTGWNVQQTVPYKLGIGLAVSSDYGQHFERVSAGPVMSVCRSEPFWCAQPSVLVEGGIWRMWYLSCSGWRVIDQHPEPYYRVKYAESHDGLDWTIKDRVCIDYDNYTDAIGRPCVVKRGQLYHMFYSYRRASGYRTDPSRSYRIGYAVSRDGLVWEKNDAASGISISPRGWDSQMIEYCHVWDHKGSEYMIYNGNGFGRSGFGLATLASDAQLQTAI